MQNQLTTKYHQYRRMLRNYPAVWLFRRQLRNQPRLRGTVYMTVMGGCLHVAELAIACIPEDIPLVIILNGLDGWERRWAFERWRDRALMVTLRKIYHHEVIESLVHENTEPFFILDFDCMVLDPAIFATLDRCDPDTAMLGYYTRYSNLLERELPETFFMGINPKVIRGLMKRYNASARQTNWHGLSGRTRRALEAMQLGPDSKVEDHKAGFDTLRVLMILALAENKSLPSVRSFSPTDPFGEELWHVGGVSYAKPDHPGLYEKVGVYFWAASLDHHPDADLRAHYTSRRGKIDLPALWSEIENHPEHPSEQLLARLKELENLRAILRM